MKNSLFTKLIFVFAVSCLIFTSVRAATFVPVVTTMASGYVIGGNYSISLENPQGPFPTQNDKGEYVSMYFYDYVPEGKATIIGPKGVVIHYDTITLRFAGHEVLNQDIPQNESGFVSMSKVLIALEIVNKEDGTVYGKILGKMADEDAGEGSSSSGLTFSASKTDAPADAGNVIQTARNALAEEAKRLAQEAEKIRAQLDSMTAGTSTQTAAVGNDSWCTIL